ncbi:DUF4180 domain-containing protein [Brevibacillus choshinensis]|uniref:DUF4180 domain-containing protein n=1 Tax=Brevibacillus choshinensis TaxID=54911 RepID=A0ABX7FPZ4_BRECH|nr:DUF4180 domain-containing protein [Brevibacillus choshinensis]QRG68314.1 DUF4180 domain-containing protein [Brevibacillus choshinensis]
MVVKVDQRGDSKVAIVVHDEVVINSVQDALDLIANVHYNDGCDKMIVKKEHITEDFFELKTRLAGEILQKYTNYQMKLAIVGDFSGYSSKSLSDFIYESNKGKSGVWFLGTEAEALDVLHQNG